MIAASGSEVSLACDARELLLKEGIDARVVSVPCLGLFEEQPEEYRKATIPEGIPVVAVEASLTRDWDRYTAKGGMVIGMSSFGSSAPAGVLAEKFGFTATAVAERIKALLK